MKKKLTVLVSEHENSESKTNNQHSSTAHLYFENESKEASMMRLCLFDSQPNTELEN